MKNLKNFFKTGATLFLKGLNFSLVHFQTCYSTQTRNFEIIDPQIHTRSNGDFIQEGIPEFSFPPRKFCNSTEYSKAVFPMLFNTYLEPILSEALENEDAGTHVNGKRLVNLRYVDNTA